MSIANFNSQTLFGEANVNADTVRCETLDAHIVGIEDLTCQNITAVTSNIFNATETTSQIANLILTQAPTLNNANPNALVWNSSNGNIEYNDSILPPSLLASNNVWTGTNSFKSVDVYSTASTHITLLCTSTTPYFDFNGGAGLITLPTSTTTLVGNDTGDTLSNKTIDSASNTLEVNGTNINSLINQDVRTTASPSFTQPITITGTTSATTTITAGTQYGNLNFNGDSSPNATLSVQPGSLTANRTAYLPDANGTIVVNASPTFLANSEITIYTFSGTTTDTGTTILFTFVVPDNTVVGFDGYVMGFCTGGTDVNSTGVTQFYAGRAANIGGTVTSATCFTQANQDLGGSLFGCYTTTSTNTFLLNVSGPGSLDVVQYTGHISIYY